MGNGNLKELKFLVLSDLHGRVNHYFIEELNVMYDFNAVMILGDITHFGPAKIVKDVSTKDITIFAIPGNCDPPEILNSMNESGIVNMHKNTFIFSDYKIVGLGGTDFNNVSMGIVFSDNEAFEFLNKNLDEKTILMLHQPPYGILDEINGKHVGNKGIRRAVDEKRPFVVMFGHIHENAGKYYDGKTLFFNPGPAKDGRYAILKIFNGKADVEFFKR